MATTSLARCYANRHPADLEVTLIPLAVIWSHSRMLGLDDRARTKQIVQSANEALATLSTPPNRNLPAFMIEPLSGTILLEI